MTDWITEAKCISDEIINNRRYLHMHPEAGNREFETAGFIEKKLSEYGIRTKRLLDTAVIGYIDFGKQGPSAALRADMDALPVTEDTGYGFSSLNHGMMHACGHDVHMSAVLGAARLLMKHKDELKGSLRLIFQPDEEGDGGAERLVNLGVMEGVDAVFGAHVSPDLEVGSVGFRYGKFYAASDVFHVTVKGRSSHGAEPEKGIDALYASALMVERLHLLPEECLPDRAVLTVGQMEAGTAVNIVAGESSFSGIIRTLGRENREHIKNRFKEIITAAAKETNVTADIRIKGSYPGVVNSMDITESAEASALKLLGRDRVFKLSSPTMTTEDFGYYIEAAKGTFYHIGAGPNAALHNAGFLPEEIVPVNGAAIHAAIISDFLSQ